MKVTKLSERYEISEGEYKIYVTVADGEVEITTDRDKLEFVFSDLNGMDTRERWSTVASLIKRATKLMEEE